MTVFLGNSVTFKKNSPEENNLLHPTWHFEIAATNTTPDLRRIPDDKRRIPWSRRHTLSCATSFGNILWQRDWDFIDGMDDPDQPFPLQNCGQNALHCTIFNEHGLIEEIENSLGGLWRKNL
jgi:hypothetical protein